MTFFDAEKQSNSLIETNTFKIREDLLNLDNVHYGKLIV